MARHPYKSPAIFLVCLMFLSILPLYSVDAAGDGQVEGRSSSSSYATSFIHEYNITGDGEFYDYLVGYEGNLLTPYAYDDIGNLYLVINGDTGSVLGHLLSPEGLHILKVSPAGTLLWGKTISTSYNMPVETIEVIDEDEFYISFIYESSGSTTITFSSTVVVSIPSNGLESYVVAFHDATNGWMWAESNLFDERSNPRWNTGLDSNDNYITTHYLGIYYDSVNNRNYHNFSITSYSSLGKNWEKNVQYYYGLQIATLFMDIEGTNLHFFAETRYDWTFDGQTTNCPSSQPTACHFWLTLDSTGAKVSAITKPHPWVFFTTFSVRQGDAYLSGIAGGDSGPTQHNFTGTPTNFSANGDDEMYSFATKLNSNGAWGYLQSWTLYDDDFTPLQEWNMFVHDNGSVTHMIFQEGNHLSFNGNQVSMIAQMMEQVSIVTFDSQGVYQMHNSIALAQSYDIEMFMAYLDEDNGYLAVSVWTDTIHRFGPYHSLGTQSNSNRHASIIWYSTINGSILDYETSLFTYFSNPLASSPDGDMLFSHSSEGVWLSLYAVDQDGDDIGSTDNCPDDYNPLQEDYDLDLQGDVCDDDDDADTIPDLVDSCSMGEKGWVSNSVTDHDSDGCKDVHAEDPDDDNDGLSDQFDSCPVGITGTGGDHDGDGCKDAEDSDDDNDLIGDGSDYCSQGNVGWLSGEVTDYDSDGCRDDIEDDDDDNDGVLDTSDQCPRGELDWKSNINTDFDGDGCKDSVEDVDDDADGVNNPYDDCPYSIGEVDEAGCSAQQYLNSGGNQSMPSIFYVCEGGTAVVLDLDDCPEHSGGEGNNSSENNSGGENQTENNDTMLPSIYFVCEGGKAIVLNYSDCPEVESETEQNQSNLNFDNITLVLSTNTTLPEGFALCPSGKAIVVDMADCPEYQNTNNNISSNDGVSSGSSGDDDLVTTMVYASFLLALIAVLIVLIRRPVVQSASPLIYDETSQFSEEKNTMIPIFDSPPLSLKGVPNEGFEWIEYPDNSDQHWFRPLDSNGAWTKHV